MYHSSCIQLLWFFQQAEEWTENTWKASFILCNNQYNNLLGKNLVAGIHLDVNWPPPLMALAHPSDIGGPVGKSPEEHDKELRVSTWPQNSPAQI